MMPHTCVYHIHMHSALSTHHTTLRSHLATYSREDGSWSPQLGGNVWGTVHRRPFFRFPLPSQHHSLSSTMPFEGDAVAKLMGYKPGADLRGWGTMQVTVPMVALVLLIAVFTFRVVADVATRTLKLSKTAPPRGEVGKQVAFGVVGILLHSYLGPAALFTAMDMLPATPGQAAGNRAALSAAPEWYDRHNAAQVNGEIFTGYAVYITIMWLLGWEKGVDKIIHHVVFLFLAVTLAGSNVFARLSSFAMAMELSTPFLNINLISDWFDGRLFRITHLIMGSLFILSFVFLRIGVFGYGLFTTMYHYYMDRSIAPLPEPLAWAVLLLFLGGWLIQVYWLGPIWSKIVGVLGKKKKAD
eukprot:Sspe_Gene.70815::Locus_41850_Transcript_1_1_Confidence_1.000_Length_1180::g.70815::m.70815